jgi:hypothetical protein
MLFLQGGYLMRVRRFAMAVLFAACGLLPSAGSAQCSRGVCAARPVARVVEGAGAVVRRVARVPVRVVERAGSRLACWRAARHARHASSGSSGGYQTPASYGSAGGYQAPSYGAESYGAESYGSCGGYQSAPAATATSYWSSGGSAGGY